MELVFLRRALAEGRDWQWIVRHWSDRDETVDPVIGAFVRRWNDRVRTGADRARVFTPEILDALRGTRGSSDLSRCRAFSFADWSVRTCTPLYLCLAGLDEHAEALAALPEIVDREGALAARDVARAAAAAARKRRAEAAEAAEAEAVVWEGAWSEEEAPAAWAARAEVVEAAAWAAAWADASRVEAAWAAAVEAAAWAAAEAAVWAEAAESAATRKRLAVLGAEIETSAVALLRRVLEMRDPE